VIQEEKEKKEPEKQVPTPVDVKKDEPLPTEEVVKKIEPDIDAGGRNKVGRMFQTVTELPVFQVYFSGEY